LEYMREKNYRHWVFIDASHYDGALRAVEKAFMRALSAELERANLKAGQAYFMVATEDGVGYERISKAIERHGDLKVFYLEGGMRAYREQAERQIAIWERNPERVGERPRCGRS
jgi:predicted sulfurtransferase